MGEFPNVIEATTPGGVTVKHVISIPVTVLITIFAGTILITLFKYFTK